MKILKNNQHGNSEIYEGSRKDILNQLRIEARDLRRCSRLKKGLKDNIHSISSDLHPSKLVTMASYEFENKGLKQLLELLSNHGVCNYVEA